MNQQLDPGCPSITDDLFNASLIDLVIEIQVRV
jgi:hypothetical protein